MTADQIPVAYLYDRCATSSREALRQRLETCAEYLTDKGWGFGGWWVDEGDDALTDRRPKFDLLLLTMRAETERPRVCLVYSWLRFSSSEPARGRMTRRVLQNGGWVETTGGDRRVADGTYAGRLTSGPIAT